VNSQTSFVTVFKLWSGLNTHKRRKQLDYLFLAVRAGRASASGRAPLELSRDPSAQGQNNRTLISHKRVDSRFSVLPGSDSTFTEITE